MFEINKIIIRSHLFMFLALSFILGGTAWAQVSPPNTNVIVGTAACPKLNAHSKKACTFTRPGSHNFQVWPGRISVQATQEPGIWLVTSTGHRDGMFDHVLGWGKRDDHINFQCFIKGGGNYFGPFGFNIDHGGAWKTYGQPATTATVVTGAVVAIFNPPVGGVIVAGGTAGAELGPALSKLGSKSWEAQAGKVAADICAALAS